MDNFRETWAHTKGKIFKRGDVLTDCDVMLEDGFFSNKWDVDLLWKNREKIPSFNMTSQFDAPFFTLYLDGE